MSFPFASIFMNINKFPTFYIFPRTISEYIRTTLEFSDVTSENFRIWRISLGFYFSRISSEVSEIARVITKILLLIDGTSWYCNVAKMPKSTNESLFHASIFIWKIEEVANGKRAGAQTYDLSSKKEFSKNAEDRILRFWRGSNAGDNIINSTHNFCCFCLLEVLASPQYFHSQQHHQTGSSDTSATDSSWASTGVSSAFSDSNLVTSVVTDSDTSSKAGSPVTSETGKATSAASASQLPRSIARLAHPDGPLLRALPTLLRLQLLLPEVPTRMLLTPQVMPSRLFLQQLVLPQILRAQALLPIL